jgi:hypothetical protein
MRKKTDRQILKRIRQHVQKLRELHDKLSEETQAIKDSTSELNGDEYDPTRFDSLCGFQDQVNLVIGKATRGENNPPTVAASIHAEVAAEISRRMERTAYAMVQ